MDTVMKWEYRVTYLFHQGAEYYQNDLNELGRDGWELVSFIPIFLDKSACSLYVLFVPCLDFLSVQESGKLSFQIPGRQ